MPRIAFLLLLAPLPALADEATLLDDLAFPGRFQLDPWNKAPGELAVAGDELRVGIDWPDDDEFRFFSIQPTASRGPIPYWLKEVSLQVFAGADGHFVEVHFKSSDGKDVKVGWKPKGGAWETLRQPVPNDWVQPLTLTGVTWHNWGMKGAGGRAEVRLKELTGLIDDKQKLVPGDDKPALLVAPAVPYGLAAADGNAEVALRLLAWRPLEQAVALRLELTDDAGQAVAASDAQLTAEQPARREHVQLPRNGTYRLRVTAPSFGAETGLARLPAVPQLTADERRRSPIGVNTHFGAPWAAFEAMGIHWARDYSWGWLGRGETAPVGNGRDYAAVLADAERHHVQVLPVSMDAFRNAAKTGWNEDSGAMRDKGFDLDDYARALLAARDGLQRGGLQRGGAGSLVLNGTAGIRLDQAEVLLRGPAKDAFVVVNSHYYTGTMPPEPAVYDANLGGADRKTPLTFLDQLRLINRLAHAAGKESWLTEVGWDVTNGPAVGEALQAVYLPRAYLLAWETGTDKTFWFYDRDVPNAQGIFSTCGLLRLDGSIRPSGVAMAALSAQIARATYGGSLDLGDDLWALVFKQPEGGWTVAAWTVMAEHPLPRELAGAAAVDLFGNPAQPKTIGPGVAYFRLAQLP
ncbi:MAG: hypothetical protein HYU66_10115, partial [Armatimonadetes bacterium]|nr:hypothetical protein [Armatimonadota bacterium]